MTSAMDFSGISVAQPGGRSSLARKHLRDTLTGYAFISPWIIGFLFFTGGPIVASLVLSFFRWKIITPPHFVGLDNFVRLFTSDALFRTSLWATTKYVLWSVPSAQIVALFLSILLNQK